MRSFIFGAILAGLAFPLQAQEPDFSGAPVRIVSGAPAGGPQDIVARLVASKLGPELDTTVIVENLPGALLQTAAREVMNSDADGHTMLMITISVAVGQLLHPDLIYDLTRDFDGVSLLATGPLVLVARPGLGVSNMEELVAKARDEPGGLSFASPGGTATIFFLAIEMLKQESDLDFTIVPYQGSAPARNDLLGGHVDLVFEAIPGIISHIQQGTVVPIAVTTPERAELLPDIPTMVEAGFENFEVGNWFALGAPKGTPDDRIAKLSDALARVVHQPDVVQALSDQGVSPIGSSGEDFSTFLETELARLSALIEERGLQLQ